MSFPDSTDWRPDEIERCKLAMAGTTVIANLKRDKRLIAWAETNGRFQYVGRPCTYKGRRYDGPWGNKYVEGKHGTRAEVIERHRHCFQLLERLPELRGGKVLVCWCYPRPCHGQTLADLANALIHEQDQRVASRRPVDEMARRGL